MEDRRFGDSEIFRSLTTWKMCLVYVLIFIGIYGTFHKTDEEKRAAEWSNMMEDPNKYEKWKNSPGQQLFQKLLEEYRESEQ